MHDHATGLETGKVEQVADEPVEPLRLAVDDLDLLLADVVAGAVPVVHEGHGEAADGGERRSQLVGDGGQEVGLHAVELLEPLDRLALPAVEPGELGLAEPDPLGDEHDDGGDEQQHDVEQHDDAGDIGPVRHQARAQHVERGVAQVAGRLADDDGIEQRARVHALQQAVGGRENEAGHHEHGGDLGHGLRLHPAPEVQPDHEHREVGGALAVPQQPVGAPPVLRRPPGPRHDEPPNQDVVDNHERSDDVAGSQRGAVMTQLVGEHARAVQHDHTGPAQQHVPAKTLDGAALFGEAVFVGPRG